MRINEIQDEIIEEFSSFDDWMDRYSLLIDYGNGLAPFPEAYIEDERILWRDNDTQDYTPAY